MSKRPTSGLDSTVSGFSGSWNGEGGLLGSTSTFTKDGMNMKELPSELQRLSNILNDDKGDWDRRLSALQSLRALFENGPQTHSDFLSAMQSIVRQPLKEQIEDLRSAISKEACACVKALCTSTGDTWEVMSDWYIGTLLHNTTATVAVIAEAAEDTLHFMASCGRMSSKALTAILQGTGHKHSTARRNAYNCLLRLLTFSDNHLVMKSSAAISKAIRGGLSDAVQAPRQLARLCFWGLEAVARDEADKLLSSCEAAVQRTIEQEQGTYFVWMQESRLPDACNPAKRGLGNKNTNTTRFGTKLAQKPKSSESKQVVSSPPPKANRDEEDFTKFDDPPTPPRARAESKAAKLLGKTRGQPVVSLKTQSRSRSRGERTTQRPPNKLAEQESRIRPAGAHGGAKGASIATTRSQPKHAGVPHKRTARIAPPPPIDEAWAGILQSVKSPDWTTRLNAVNGVCELLEMNSLVRDEEGLLVVLARLNDSHHKVTLAAQSALHHYVERKRECVETHLDRVLLALVPHSHDTKLRGAIKAELEHIADAFGPETLFSILNSKVLEHNNTKVKLGAIEYCTFLMKVFSKWVEDNPQSTRNNVHRLLSVMCKDKTPSVQQGLGILLATYYDTGVEFFVQALHQFHSTEQQLLIEALKKRIPQLQQDSRRLAAGERLLQHPHSGVQSPSDRRSPAKNRTYQHTRGKAEAGPPVQGWDARSPAQKYHVDPTQEHFTSPSSMGRRNQVSSSPKSGGYRRENTSITFEQQAQHQSESLLSPHGHLLLPGNSSARVRELTELRHAVTSEDRKVAMIAARNSLSHESLWLEHFRDFFPFALAFCRDDDNTVRVTAFRWLRSIVGTQYLVNSNEASLEHYVRAVHHGIDDAFSDVRQEALVLAQETFGEFRAQDTVVAFLCFLEDEQALEKCSGKVIGFLINELGKAMARGSGSEGSYLWRELLPRAVRCVLPFSDSSETDVRKAVILTLVDFFSANQDAFLPLVAELPPAKLRLVEMYINKGGRDGVPPQQQVTNLAQLMTDRGLNGRRSTFGPPRGSTSSRY